MHACRAHVSGCNGRSEGRTPSLPRPGPSRCAFVWRRVRTTRMHCCFESFRAPRLSCLRAAFACDVWSNALSRVRSCRVCSRVLACARGGGRRKPRTRALLSCYYVPDFNPILLTSSSSIDRELHERLLILCSVTCKLKAGVLSRSDLRSLHSLESRKTVQSAH